MDPFGPAADSLWNMVKEWTQMIYLALTTPDELYGDSPIARTLFSSAWPFAHYLAVICLVTLLSWIILGGVNSLQHVFRAFLATILTGGLGSMIWVVNQQTLIMNRDAAKASLWDPGTGAPTKDPFLPYLGIGFGQMLMYVIYLLVLALLIIVVVVIIVGQSIVGGLIVVGIGLIGLGEYGRKIAQYSIASWIVCFLAGLPIITLVVSLSINLSKQSNNQWAAMFGVIGLIFAGILAVMLVFFVANMVSSRITSGRLRASVQGETDSRITNDPNVHDNEVYPAIEPAAVSAPVETVPQIEHVDVEVTPGSLTSGLITIATSGNPIQGASEIQEIVDRINESPEAAYLRYMKREGHYGDQDESS